jgi:transposase-like protein
VVVATGITAGGDREILGVDIGDCKENLLGRVRRRG